MDDDAERTQKVTGHAKSAFDEDKTQVVPRTPRPTPQNAGPPGAEDRTLVTPPTAPPPRPAPPQPAAGPQRQSPPIFQQPNTPMRGAPTPSPQPPQAGPSTSRPPNPPSGLGSYPGAAPSTGPAPYPSAQPPTGPAPYSGTMPPADAAYPRAAPPSAGYTPAPDQMPYGGHPGSYGPPPQGSPPPQSQPEPINSAGAGSPIAKVNAFIPRLIWRGINGELIRQPWFQNIRRQSADPFVYITYGVGVLVSLVLSQLPGAAGTIAPVLLWVAVAYCYFAIGTQKSVKFVAYGICAVGAGLYALGALLVLWAYITFASSPVVANSPYLQGMGIGTMLLVEGIIGVIVCAAFTYIGVIVHRTIKSITGG